MARKDARGKREPAENEPPKQGEREQGDAGRGVREPFPIVGIGSSAGGLESLRAFFQSMPSDSGMAFVVVSHQYPGQASLLSELLGRETDMPVADIQDGEKVQPNRVYVLPPGSDVTINERVLRLTSRADATPHLPIDVFFRSLARDQYERAFCVVLSGTGADGTLGLREIKAQGGMAAVQEPSSAQYNGMPAAAVATGLADIVVPPSEMPKHLLSYVRGAYLREPSNRPPESELKEEHLNSMIMQVRSRTGHDFSSYKRSTVRRRVERRMSVHGLKRPQDYISYLHENPHEAQALFGELLISVTNFFRDPDAFSVLKDRVLRELVHSRPGNHELRVWVPACATGEEAYSVAIMIAETMREQSNPMDVRVFGTDLDSRAIERARRGIYPASIAADVSPERLNRFFTRDGDDAYVVRKEIRDMLIFAVQNVLSDPPFMRLDLLVCRNLLIYLQSGQQNMLLPMFHYALRPGGCLFLGSSESIGAYTELFEPIDTRWKVYRRRDVPTHLPEPQSKVGKATAGTKENEQHAAVERRTPSTGRLLERMLLQRFVPLSVVVDSHGTIVYIHGRMGAYLEPEQQEPRNNIMEMAREGLRSPLTVALHQAVERNEVVVREAVRVKTNDHYTTADLQVTPIEDPEAIRGLYLITLTRVHEYVPEKSASEGARPDKPVPPGRVEEVERELRYARESHQTAMEEVQTTNEELQSSNEELQSSNEELQSSKEEMESLNEELSTVNNELNSKVEALARTRDDMRNLLNSTDLAVIFVDEQLQVKRYTDSARPLVNLRDSDVGRPLADLTVRLQYDDVLNDCREVLDTLVRKEKEVTTTDGSWLLMRVLPYRSSENVIGGVVITFVDITRLKYAEQQAEYFNSIVSTVREPLLVLDADLRVVSANKSFHRTFDTTDAETGGRLIYELDNNQWDIPRLRELLDNILAENRSFADFEVAHAFPRVGHKRFLFNARRLVQAGGMPEMILLAMEEQDTR